MKGKTIVTYFSAEGTTAAVAKIVATELNADLFEISPEKSYTAEDLDWKNGGSRSSVEMRDTNSRPSLLQIKDVSAYDNVLIGFPIWWYVEPRIIDAFLESQSFAGKNMIPFATSGGSGLEKAAQRLKSVCPAANWKEGKLLTVTSAVKWAQRLQTED